MRGMRPWQRDRGNEGKGVRGYGKRRVFWCAVLAQLVILLLCIGIALFRENQVYSYGAEDFGQEGEYLNSVPISLPRGIYRVELRYSCEGSMRHFCSVESAGEQEALVCSGEHLSEGLGCTSFDLWIKDKNVPAVVRVQLGEGELGIQGLHIVQTGRDMSRAVCLLLLLFLMADAFCLYLGQEKRAGVAREKKLVFLGLCAITLGSSVPLLTDYIHPGSDITYHLLRIGNIKDGLLGGQFPVRIDPAWLYGHGYASSVCYGDIFLYIPAVLRILGFTLQESYACFLFLLNAATCLISYFGFKSVFRDWKLGLLGSAVYTLSIYRLYKMYSWGALGEAQSMVFLPLIFCAVYHIFTDEGEDEKYGRLWVPLGIGFAGIILCHVLTVEITVLFLAAACVVFWKRLFRRKTFLLFAKGAVFAAALTAWFVIPFLDYYLNVDMVIHHVSTRTIQEVGLYPANLLFAFFLRGSTRDLAAYGMQYMEALGIGLPLTAAGLGIGMMWLFGYMRKRTGLVLGAKLALLFGGAACLMSLSSFPWTRIQFLNGVTEKLVSSIQYPNRFLMIATLLLSFGAGACVAVCGECFGKRAMAGGGAAFVALALLTAFFYQSSIVRDGGALYLYDEKGMGTGYLSGAEYLRYGIDQADLSFHGAVEGQGVRVLDYEKDNLNVRMNIRNESGGESYVEVPLQHYKGYTAVVSATGERLELEDGSHFDIRIRVPEGFEGEVSVGFASLWYWHLGNGISLLGLAVVLAQALRRRLRRRESA